MKNIIKIVVFIIIFILSIVVSFFIVKNFLLDSNTTEATKVEGTSNALKNSRKEEELLENSKNQKYYLHESDLDYPNQEQCNIANAKTFEGLNDNEKLEISSEIKQYHQNIESLLLDSISLLKNPNSPYWDIYTTEGVFEEPGHPETKILSNGEFAYILKALKNISNKIKNDTVKADLNEACTLLQQGIDNHDVGKFFEAHKIIHDYDYWVCNPYVFLQIEPPDWEGAYTFFNKASIIK